MSSTAIANDPVRQLSVFIENRVGRLSDLTSLLQRNHVHVIALTIIDATDSSILRLIVDDLNKARELLVNNDFPYTETEVLAVEITDESSLTGVLAALLEAELNIHYIYSLIKRPDHRAALIISLEDADVAAQSLNHHGYKILTQGDISR